MDAALRRGTYGRIPGLAALSLFALAALSVIFVSTSVGGIEGPSLASHIYRREAGAGSRFVWRQEAGEEATDTPESGSGGNNGTKAFETSTRTTSSTTSEGVITTTTSTRNTTSTTTTSVSTTTVISTTTTRSTTSSLIPTISSSVSRTSTSSTSSIPSSTSSSSSSSSSSAFRSATTATPDTPVTTLVVPADFLTLTTSSPTSSTQTGNGFAGESNSPTPTATAGEAVGAAQKGFFQNKGAVAGVFVVVALVAICLLGLLFIHVARRRAAARQRRLHAQLFGGKYSKSEESHDAGAQAHGRSGSGGSNGGSEKGIVYDDSRFRGATVTSDYPFGPGQGLRAFSSPPSPPTAPSQPSLPAQQQSAAFLPPSQNPFLDPAPASVGQYPSGSSTYPYNPDNSAGAHSLESHYTHEDPFYTPPMSQSHSPNPNLGLQPALIPALTVTSPHNTQYLPRVPSGSTILSHQGLTFGGQVQGDGASTYSQQSFEGLAYDYRDSNPFADGGGALPPGGLRGSYGQASIDSFYGGPASGGVKGPTITVQY